MRESGGVATPPDLTGTRTLTLSYFRIARFRTGPQSYQYNAEAILMPYRVRVKPGCKPYNVRCGDDIFREFQPDSWTELTDKQAKCDSILCNPGLIVELITAAPEPAPVPEEVPEPPKTTAPQSFQRRRR